MKNINLAANTAIVVGAFVGIVAVAAKHRFFKSKGLPTE